MYSSFLLHCCHFKHNLSVLTVLYFTLATTQGSWGNTKVIFSLGTRVSVALRWFGSWLSFMVFLFVNCCCSELCHQCVRSGLVQGCKRQAAKQNHNRCGCFTAVQLCQVKAQTLTLPLVPNPYLHSGLISEIIYMNMHKSYISIFYFNNYLTNLKLHCLSSLQNTYGTWQHCYDCPSRISNSKLPHFH